MKRTHLLFLVAALSAATCIQAQTDSAAAKSKTEFKLGVYYNSNLNYYGRTDSLRSSGFFPMAELWFGKGFYINAAPVFVNNAVSSFEYAGTVATAGYRFDGKIGGNIFFQFVVAFVKLI